MQVKPFPKKQILGSSKLMEFAVVDFRLGENVKNLSKRVENTRDKGEIACYEQFLLLPLCFLKRLVVQINVLGYIWERVKKLQTIEYSFLC